MDIKRLILSAGLLFGACGFAGSANAVILTEEHSVSYSFASIDGIFDRNPGRNAENKHIFTRDIDRLNLNLTRFDGSLGELVGVDIWYSTDYSLSSTVTALDPRGNKKASARGLARIIQTVQLRDPFKEVDSERTVVRSSCNDKPLCSETVSDSGVLGDSFGLGGFTLADFIGANPLDFRVIRKLDSDLQGCGKFDFCSHESANDLLSGNIYVRYSYDVPEPSSLALMGLGLFGLLAGRKRRRGA